MNAGPPGSVLRERLRGLTDADLVLEGDGDKLHDCLQAAAGSVEDAREHLLAFIEHLEQLLQDGDLRPDDAAPVISAAREAVRELSPLERFGG